MAQASLIGIVGGYGAVGTALARRLKSWRVGRLRIGGRRLERASRFAHDVLQGNAEACQVDYDDLPSVQSFCEGCSVVVNCAGPSYRILDRLARVALEHGADYVDSYGDDPVYERLKGLALAKSGRRVILSAGVMPGMAGLLPRWLARRGFQSTHRLSAYIGGLERVTPAAAADYLLSLGSGYGESLAAWRNGRRAAKALAPQFRAELPFFHGPVTAYPYLSTEAERLARALSLKEGNFYNIFDGENGLAALNRLQGQMVEGADLNALAAELARAAELDLFGRTRYQVLLFELDGEAAGRSLTRTLVVRANDGFELSGTLGALAVSAVVAGEVPPGLHFAADALDPDLTIERIRSSSAIQSFELLDGPAAGATEEGAI